MKKISITIIFLVLALMNVPFEDVNADDQSICSEWKYSEWSECVWDGQSTRPKIGWKTREIISSPPPGCDADPIASLKSNCTPIPSCIEHKWSCDEWGSCQKDGRQYRNCTLTYKCPDIQTDIQAEIPPGGTSQMCVYSERVSFNAPPAISIIPAAVPSTNIVHLNIPPICTSTIWKRLSCENGEAIEIEIPQSPEGCKLHQSAPRIVKCDSVKEPIIEKTENLKNVEHDQSIVKLKGLILLQVEARGEAWYVNPGNVKRYYLGRPADAFQIMRELGLGASHAFIVKYKNGVYPDNVIGKILIDAGDSGKAYYIYPKNKKAYYLGRPADAFRVMRELGLGISNGDLGKITTN